MVPAQMFSCRPVLSFIYFKSGDVSHFFSSALHLIRSSTVVLFQQVSVRSAKPLNSSVISQRNVYITLTLPSSAILVFIA